MFSPLNSTLPSLLGHLVYTYGPSCTFLELIFPCFIRIRSDSVYLKLFGTKLSLASASSQLDQYSRSVDNAIGRHAPRRTVTERCAACCRPVGRSLLTSGKNGPFIERCLLDTDITGCLNSHFMTVSIIINSLELRRRKPNILVRGIHIIQR